MNKWTSTIKNILIVLIVIAIAFVFKRQVDKEVIVRVESPNKVVMNTTAKIVALAYGKGKAQKCIDAGFEKIFEAEKLMNRFDANSQISKVNMLAAKQNVKVDKELFDILKKSVDYYYQTGGAFDITIGPLVDLWRKCAEANSLPSEQQLEQTLKFVGSDKLLLDANDCSVRFAVEGMKLDLGGIAKGFAVDIAGKAMSKAGATGGFISIGGEAGCFGTNEENAFWIVGIQNPFILSNSKEDIIAKLALSYKNVSTSGNYRRYYEIGGRRYNHILNPKTGKSANEIAGVTVITSDGPQADAMATAISVLGTKAGLKLIEETYDAEAIVINQNGDIFTSSGARQYLIK